MKINVTKILCPVDYSKTSEHAMRYAVALADTFGAELVLLHVNELPAISMAEYYALSSGEFGLASAALPGAGMGASPSVDKEAQEALDKLAAELRKSHSGRITTCHRTGTAFLEIIRAAREEIVDVVVMGTHGRTGLSHVLMGSTAEKVVRMAPCPVLTVKHPQHEFVMP